ncbi:Zn-ribbon domain-containing OB-fold protein [Parahaliea mediterranea]|uniref:Short-chain dehydrogenase n=1 Tax=Parahaliea mediterranea TaxID=651086 RepID=A0A939IMU5_9GAMM|nr:zinc ribbon domain-containing protein [Parahaliea mediterranea]MBN7797403.1 short-chain dehydrogenase [Parahaliea mediterranea]
MSKRQTMRQRLKLNRPSRRRLARPPRQRTPVGMDFTAANLPVALSLQHCSACGAAQYPPREVCGDCLCPTLVWREAETGGTLLAGVDLHHSLWEFFKRRIAQAPWPVASVRLDCGVTVFAHLALHTFSALPAKDAASLPADTRVAVFSHSDASRNAVLIAVSADTPIAERGQRRAIAQQLELTSPAEKPEGI